MSSRPEGREGAFRLILGDREKPNFVDVAECVRAADAEFRPKGDVVLNEGEALGLIVQIAKVEGFAPQDLILKRVLQTPDGHLVQLAVKIVPAQAKAHGWGAIEFEYDAAGTGAKTHSSKNHLIWRFHSDLENPEKPDDWTAAGLVAEHDGEKWVLNPNHMADFVEIKLT